MRLLQLGAAAVTSFDGTLIPPNGPTALTSQKYVLEARAQEPLNKPVTERVGALSDVIFNPPCIPAVRPTGTWNDWPEPSGNVALTACDPVPMITVAVPVLSLKILFA